MTIDAALRKKLLNVRVVHRTRWAIKREGLLTHSEQPVVVGLSGGADSCALLLLLYLLGYRLVAAHFNFQLRGKESDGDEAFVRALCAQYQIPLHVRRRDTLQYAREQGLSVEVAARELRYAYFYELAAETGAQAIAVAHHLEDNIETMLRHLALGSGVAGLRGMRYRNGIIVRPLLEITPEELRQFLRQARCSFRTDSTNSDTRIERNYIRHTLRPLFDRLNPSFDAAAAHTLGILREQEALQRAYIEQTLPMVYRVNTVNLAKLRDTLAPATLLHEVLSPLGFNRSQEKEVLQSVAHPHSRAVWTSNLYTLKKQQDYLYVMPRASELPAPKTELCIPTALSPVQSNGAFRLELVETLPEKDKLGSNAVALDYDALQAVAQSSAFILRSVDASETFRPFGLRGKRKNVGKILREAKRSPGQIQAQQVLTLRAAADNLTAHTPHPHGEPPADTTQELLIWLPGVMASCYFPVTAHTRTVLLIAVTPAD